ncbi:MAG: peptide-methionine (S)-S-oxide reductase MsrA, partial [Candidatus Heimdallarchaeota archaeon]|nr:peptide-methionine (S)-S-oxide reductase MsrA [Candidatus Heimdallarchaeota archaeon]MCK4877146.1 peptide-methionine (S)-S-oxide reductase MsrA [Candidatus Heimdallarchaeota archaeon]
MIDNKTMEKTTLGGGCFWCLEAVFADLKGIEKIESGYSGGQQDNPAYEQVCTGSTGHAEVVQITFDPILISFQDILAVFFDIHDPTTLNRQGNDIGTQYRSVIFHHSERQRDIANTLTKELEKSQIWEKQIVT